MVGGDGGGVFRTRRLLSVKQWLSKYRLPQSYHRNHRSSTLRGSKALQLLDLHSGGSRPQTTGATTATTGAAPLVAPPLAAHGHLGATALGLGALTVGGYLTLSTSPGGPPHLPRARARGRTRAHTRAGAHAHTGGHARTHAGARTVQTPCQFELGTLFAGPVFWHGRCTRVTRASRVRSAAK